MDKQTLRRFRQILQEINGLEAAKRAVLDGYLAPPTLTGMPLCHGSHDRLAGIVANRAKYQEQIDVLLDELIALRDGIELVMAMLPPQDQLLIHYRYIEGRNWERIAEALGCGWRQVLRRHGHILQKISGR